jgi:glycosyltransferase involved in cell wall biosynthesis
MTSPFRKISIVTVCFQSARTLERTILSVLEQGYPELEYIIVDGGSRDGTLDIIRKYEGRITRWITEKDEGVYDAMNKGIAMATGEWIGLLNSDDVYLPGTLENVNAAAGAGAPDVLYANIRMMYPDRAPMLYRSAPALTAARFWNMPVWHPTVFVRKDLYDKHGAFQRGYKIAGDYELMVRLHSRGSRFAHVDRVWVEMDSQGLSDRKWLEGKREVRKAALANGIYSPRLRTLFLLDLWKSRLSGALEKLPLLRGLQKAYRNAKAALRGRG